MKGSIPLLLLHPLREGLHLGMGGGPLHPLTPCPIPIGERGLATLT
ncbi:MAG: hypothetical protein ACE5D4_02335 [Thermodesulfobacteriota bacterium]